MKKRLTQKDLASRAISSQQVGEVVLTSSDGTVITFGPNGIWLYTTAGIEFIPYSDKKQAIINKMVGE